MRFRAYFLTIAAAASACVCSPKKDEKNKPTSDTGTTTSTGTDSGGTSEAGVTLNDDVLAYAKGFVLDKTKAEADMGELTESPHPFGSPRQAEINTWLDTRLTSGGSRVVRDKFTATTPNPAAETQSGPVSLTVDIDGTNIIALDNVATDAPCVVAFGTHTDTKIVAGSDYVGANDSGSSTVALLHMLAHVKAQKPAGLKCDLVGFFFDGEEAVLPNWDDGKSGHPANIEDHTYGSASIAKRLTSCTYAGKNAKCLPAELGGKPLVALVNMDMIGSPNIRITRESLSTDSLVTLASKAAKSLGVDRAYDFEERGVEDDHIPFLQAGVAAVDLIDFNHIDHWHKAGDDKGTISYESIEVASRIAFAIGLSVAKEPEKYVGSR